VVDIHTYIVMDPDFHHNCLNEEGRFQACTDVLDSSNFPLQNRVNKLCVILDTECLAIK